MNKMPIKKLSIESCPFCENTEVKISVVEHPKLQWVGQIQCQNCGATGSICGGQDTPEAAEEYALRNWKEATRK